MKRQGVKKRGLVALVLILITLPVLHAQERRAYSNIFEALEATLPGQGMIRITQSPAIQARIGTPSDALARARIINGVAVLPGYRIQVYSGNLSNSRSIANTRESQIRNAVPEHEVSVEYDAPFWRVRVGNFTDRAEAEQVMALLQKQFPSFAREMYLVRTQVRIPQ